MRGAKRRASTRRLGALFCFFFADEARGMQELTSTCSYTVEPDKLAYFLKTQVVGRAKNQGGRRKKDAPTDDDNDARGTPRRTMACNMAKPA